MDSTQSLGLPSSDPKTDFVRQIQRESAVTNARVLITKLNEYCFEKCIPSPGTSLSKKEQTCLSTCMEKYMATWNQVSRTYIARAQQGQSVATGVEDTGGGGGYSL